MLEHVNWLVKCSKIKRLKTNLARVELVLNFARIRRSLAYQDNVLNAQIARLSVFNSYC